jgi:uncharacterized RDD family membrane protein YckC
MLDDTLNLETPEHVELELALAGIGSRFLAGFIDSLFQALIILALGLVAGYLRWFATGDPSRLGLSIGIAAVSAILIIILYYLIFELAWGGQSPGKRMAGLVVVRDDGGPIGLTESAVRNILRIVDILPVYYTVGMVAILLNRRSKRLGDLAAGTLVIKLRQFVPKQLEQPAPAAPAPTPFALASDPLVARVRTQLSALTPRELDTVARFVGRRFELQEASRRALAERIAAGLRAKLPGVSVQEVPDPEVFLDLVHRAATSVREDR